MNPNISQNMTTHISPTIYIGADHRGFAKKAELLKFFNQNHLLYQDLGAYAYSATDDYNDFAIAVAEAVRANENSTTPKPAFGLLICGSAHGMVIQANRFKGIRAVTATDETLIKLSREHNDANVLCLSADFLDQPTMEKLILTFINTKFSGEERHVRRIRRLDEREDYA